MGSVPNGLRDNELLRASGTCSCVTVNISAFAVFKASDCEPSSNRSLRFDVRSSARTFRHVTGRNFPFVFNNPSYVNEIPSSLAWSTTETFEFVPGLKFFKHRFLNFWPLLFELCCS